MFTVRHYKGVASGVNTKSNIQCWLIVIDLLVIWQFDIDYNDDQARGNEGQITVSTLALGRQVLSSPVALWTCRTQDQFMVGVCSEPMMRNALPTHLSTCLSVHLQA